MRDKQITNRRNFLNLAALGAGTLAMRTVAGLALPAFPKPNKSGLITVDKVDVFSGSDAV